MGWAFIGIAVVAILYYLGEPPTDLPSDGVNVILDFANRGPRLSVSTLDADGVVQEDPDSLVAQASAVVGYQVTRDHYAAARAVRSEEGSADTLTKIRLINVLQNIAGRRGISVWTLVLSHNTASRDGKFGRQISGQVASTQDPYASDLAAAEQADNGDQTFGARHFVDLLAFGVQQGSGSFAATAQSWYASERVKPGTLPGSPSRIVWFWEESAFPSQATEVAT